MIRLALLDRMVFRPCREPIATQGVEQEVLKVPGGTAELWIREIGAAGPYMEKNAVSAEVAKPIVVLKFPGTSGRAENAGPQPLSLWPSRRGVVIAVNPPGYGATRGRARLARLAPAPAADRRAEQRTRVLLAEAEIGDTAESGCKCRLDRHGAVSRGAITEMAVVVRAPAIGLSLIHI